MERELKDAANTILSNAHRDGKIGTFYAKLDEYTDEQINILTHYVRLCEICDAIIAEHGRVPMMVCSLTEYLLERKEPLPCSDLAEKMLPLIKRAGEARQQAYEAAEEVVLSASKEPFWT